MGSGIQWMPSRRQMSNIKWDNKLAPRLESNASGIPNSGTTSVTSSWAMRLAFESGMGNAKSHFVRKSWKTNTYRFPWLVYGNSKTSTPTIWNGRLTGMWCSGERWCRPPPPVTCDNNTLRTVNHKLHNISVHATTSVAWVHHRSSLLQSDLLLVMHNAPATAARDSNVAQLLISDVLVEGWCCTRFCLLEWIVTSAGWYCELSALLLAESCVHEILLTL